MRPDAVRSILATDCGSTTTKAILIERRGDSYRLVARGEAPTTVALDLFRRARQLFDRENNHAWIATIDLYQALVFFEPILRTLFRLADYDRFRTLIQRREHLETFTRLIEQRADAARSARVRRG